MNGADRVAEARTLLTSLGFDAERSNERSALILLVLLGVTPQAPWSSARNPRLRTVEIMEHIRAQYGVDYKPNTRETVRRRTLHQFAEVMLIEQNPDDPGRPVNSPKWCYQVTDRALAVIRAYGTPDFDNELTEYLADLPGLSQRYAAARELERIPVTTLNGTALTLSPGGQNVLIKQIVEDFGAYFLPGGQVFYLGDADAKWSVWEQGALAGLGVTVDVHGKMPDVIVYMPDRNWLVLMEAASSHGPVDAKRHGELQTLFAGSTAGLVYVSCFPSRAEMRKYLHEIAWETEVWCADDPTHLIHFNGERFLGPYQ
ncbi:hypothetical protein KIH74_15265 [Kineosporia sp. J2-2]|uniref:Restriction endonuclease n=1 Tax=Kineosporia corallincola TaxID=2835133 RepID=A0ABS5TGT5_9ACTN|nr:BsuBI/PstI family type II restriction endonuclease [Kineosporia corallincola]MBT0770300.1 hypothetical protein [Kineosporia corallincola]